MIRLTVTYLDPVLLHYFALNNTLANNSGIDVAAFQNDLQRVTTALAPRNELLFIVTITVAPAGQQANDNNGLRVALPIKSMALINSRDLRVYPVQSDPILSENALLSSGFLSGIVGYPIAVGFPENCTWVMDQGNTTLTLSVPNVMINSTAYASQSWSIPYRSLMLPLSPVTLVNTPTPQFNPAVDWQRITQLAIPPSPSMLLNPGINDMNRKVYWEDMGRYLWNFLLPHLYP